MGAFGAINQLKLERLMQLFMIEFGQVAFFIYR